jgi:hypothetical protein
MRLGSSMLVVCVISLGALAWGHGAAPSARAAESPIAIPAVIPMEQGEGDAKSPREACEAAKADCANNLRDCPKERIEVNPKCPRCWKGGEQGWVCQAECSCKPEKAPVASDPPSDD